MQNKSLFSLYIAVVLLSFSAVSQALDFEKHPKLKSVVDQLVQEKRYSRGELQAIFNEAQVQQSVLDAMTNPAEYSMTWGKYRKIFMQPDRIQQGVEFWQEYREPLQRAEQQYGVPASMIVAIIGVESKFGKYKGSHKVLDSLVTLVTGYERRSEFFARELREFLILTKENNLPATEILGSYAGAVGFPQFIASSYRAYAVDFSGDGITDLINQPIDAIGSVANYFVENGWLRDKPITSTEYAQVPAAVAERANNRRKVQYTAASLREIGAPLASSVDASEKLGVLMLNASEVVPPKKQATTYTVRAGDTACEIAEAHKVPCRSLREHNKLNSKAAIYRGQRLRIPGKSTTGSNSVAEDPRYFFTHENFYVITRYNQSVLYAMAVHDLSAAIASAKSQQVANAQGIN